MTVMKVMKRDVSEDHPSDSLEHQGQAFSSRKVNVVKQTIETVSKISKKQPRFHKSWDAVQNVNKNRMHLCASN